MEYLHNTECCASIPFNSWKCEDPFNFDKIMNLNKFYNEFYSCFLNFTVVENEQFHKGQWYLSDPHPQWSPSSLVFCPQQIIKITFSWRLSANMIWGIINHEDWSNKQKVGKTWTLKYWSNRLCVMITQTHTDLCAQHRGKLILLLLILLLWWTANISSPCWLYFITLP